MLPLSLSGITPKTFFKEPVPLIIGAFPWTDSPPNSYSFLDVYSTSTRIKIYYSSFIGKYISNTNEVSLTPYFSNFIMNPFFNSETGYTCWHQENDAYKILYYPEEETYKYNYGSTYPYISGYAKNFFEVDHFWKGEGDEVYNSFDSLLPLISSDYDTAYTWDPTAKTPITGNVSPENFPGSGAIGKYFVFKEIPDGQNQVQSFTLNFDYTGIRQEICPDLDHEEDNSIPEICGIYTKGSTKQAFGNFVLGSEENPSFGNFIGLQNCYTYSNFTSYGGKYINSFPLSLSSTFDGNAYTSQQSGLKEVYCYIGTTYNLDTPKHLVQIQSTLLPDPWKNKRYFILEGNNIDPTKARKFYYFDPPYYSSESYSISESTLFKSSTNWSKSGQPHVNTFTFKYMNLDDEGETLPDVTLGIIGMTRKNALDYMKNVGNSINGLYKKVYIGDWLTPTILLEQGE